MADEGTGKIRATSFEVAERAGVSRSSVSRAFTPGASISPVVKKKVIKAADELGYRVNYVARSLNKQRSELVGMIASGMVNPHRARQINALAQQLVREGFRPMLFCIDEGQDTEMLISMLLNYAVSGVIITSDAPPAAICRDCAKLEVPLVLVDRSEDLPFVDHITSDNVKGGQLLAGALLDAGCKRLFVVEPEPAVYSVTTRIEAFAKAARDKGAELIYSRCSGHEFEDGQQAADALARQLHSDDGVFCPSDMLALGFIDRLKFRYGVGVPDQVSVVGYDNIPQCEWGFARLTTIDQPVESFAIETVELLKMRIQNPHAAPIQRIIDVSLVQRESA
jgi:LacI family transcriptional regulator